jgi:DNA helicase II / ATP-dependent DNA helicase PcrA
MTPSTEHLAVIAAAGSRKTEFVVNEALAHDDKRVLITTYTLNNLGCVEDRIYGKAGCVPQHITITSWYGFLLNQWCRPYQRAVLGAPGVIRGLDFESTRSRAVSQIRARQYYCNGPGDIYADWTADFAVKANDATSGDVVHRLEEMYDEIYVDEVQDLVGYDLDVLDALLGSKTHITMVGDPRQHTYATNRNRRNRKYRGAGLWDWFAERKNSCKVQTNTVSYRSNQAICDFADALFPHLPKTMSANAGATTPTGILTLQSAELSDYMAAHSPAVLRHSVTSDTLGFGGVNFGASKGSTFDHVVIFPTQPIKHYLKTNDPGVLADEARSKLYVAITRARHSVAFVV